jgi:hypothetical protein
MRAVAESVVEVRVRRVLRRGGWMLRKTRPGTPEAGEFGLRWTADPHTGNPVQCHIDLGGLALECNVLRAHEVIAE